MNLNHFRTSLFAIPLIVLLACRSDTTAPPPNGSATYLPSDSARSYFLPEATDYAIGHLLLHSSSDTSSLFVPDSIVNIYLRPLAALYDNRGSIPILDTLLGQRMIHAELVWCKSVSLKLDTSFHWVQNIIRGVTPTGDPRVDSLVQLCKLRFSAPVVLLPSYGLTAVYHEPLNTDVLSKDFRAIPGVITAGAQCLIDYQSKLSMTLSPSGASINLYYGYGDCPLGCFAYDRWTFTVSEDYEVKYMGYTHQ
jgi:hypothetical protein